MLQLKQEENALSVIPVAPGLWPAATAAPPGGSGVLFSQAVRLFLYDLNRCRGSPGAQAGRLRQAGSGPASAHDGSGSGAFPPASSADVGDARGA